MRVSAALWNVTKRVSSRASPATGAWPRTSPRSYLGNGRAFRGRASTRRSALALIRSSSPCAPTSSRHFFTQSSLAARVTFAATGKFFVRVARIGCVGCRTSIEARAQHRSPLRAASFASSVYSTFTSTERAARLGKRAPMQPKEPPLPPFPESLCHRCAAPPKYVRTASSTFILCPLLPKKYPPQPVRSCDLFRPLTPLAHIKLETPKGGH